MLPALLITFREVVEAVLVVATIAGLVIRMGDKSRIPTIAAAAGAAVLASALVIVGSSLLGLQFHNLYVGPTETLIEGVLMITSAVFMVWAVLSLHNHFAHHKVHLLHKIRGSVEAGENRVLAVLVFTAVFREGIEIALFLSTTFLQENPQQVLIGLMIGALFGLFVAALLMTFTIKLPVYWAFRASTVLLILFSAGLFVRGLGEFVELGYLPETPHVALFFMPQTQSFAHSMIQAVFGLTQTMSFLQIAVYAAYTCALLFLTRTSKQSN